MFNVPQTQMLPFFYADVTTHNADMIYAKTYAFVFNYLIKLLEKKQGFAY